MSRAASPVMERGESAPSRPGVVMDALDGAIEYLRRRWRRVAGVYLLGMTPFIAVGLIAIDSVVARDRWTALAAAGGLTVCMPIRWLTLRVVQSRVERDLHGQATSHAPARQGVYLLVRLVCASLKPLAAMLIVPGVMLWAVSLTVGPALSQEDRPTGVVLRELWRLVNREATRLVGLMMLVLVAAGLIALWGLGLQAFITETFVASLLGLDASDTRLTLWSMPWGLTMALALWMGLDLFLAVLGAPLLDALRARQLGVDLRDRVRRLDASTDQADPSLGASHGASP